MDDKELRAAKSSQWWLLHLLWLVPVYGPLVFLLPGWLIGPAASFAVSLFVLFLLPSGTGPLREPISRHGEKLIVLAEPWGSGVRYALIALGMSVVSALLGRLNTGLGLATSAMVGLIALANGIAAHRQDRITELQLSANALEVCAPTAFGTRSTMIKLGDIVDMKVESGWSSAEINFEDFTQRSVRLFLENGSRVSVPLPMSDQPGDDFVCELRRRVDAVRLGGGGAVEATATLPPRADPSALRDIVREIERRVPQTAYRGSREIAVDEDGCGFVHSEAAGSIRVSLAAARAGSGSGSVEAGSGIELTIVRRSERGGQRRMTWLERRILTRRARAWAAAVGKEIGRNDAVSVELSPNSLSVSIKLEALPSPDRVATWIDETEKLVVSPTGRS